MNAPNQPLEFFPMETPREKQIKSLEFVQRAVDRNYTDIIISAPTGIGKTGIGVALCLWASQAIAPEFMPGGYYLVTQKLLQDQLENDFPSFLEQYRSLGCSLKSATEYKCPKYTTCKAGSYMPDALRCRERAANLCTYTLQKEDFARSLVGITNYPYFFTERSYVQQMKPRTMLVADECHTLEKQILGFVDIHITIESLEEWTPFIRPVPVMPTIEEFVSWLRRKYIGALEDKLIDLKDKIIGEHANVKFQTELNKAENHLGRIKAAIVDIEREPSSWVYWQEEKNGQLESIAKPLYAHRFTKQLLFDAARIRVYLSAYPGPKAVFCRNLGLDPAKVARIDLSSTFPVENRPIHLLFCGSMGRKYIDETIPRLLRVCEKILASHPNEKGLIHCHSYKLGDAIFKALSASPHGKRLLYPRKADEREAAFLKHMESDEPTVLLSPSMTEGFSLDDDLARWQIIAKMPYPNLGDKQVEAKKDLDQEWYTLQTITTVIQACGRIVRSDTDHGVTYVLDSDFQMLFDKNPEFFPKWFTDAFVWHKR
jgi:ATP-dependent DNA helicase DinG